MKLYEDNEKKHLSWPDFLEFLERQTAGTSMLGLDMIAEIQGFQLANFCMGEQVKSLAYGLAELDSRMDKSAMYRADLPRISAVFAAFPASLRDRIRFDISNAATKEWTDYAKFKAHVLTMSAPFAEYCRYNYSPLKRKADLHAIELAAPMTSPTSVTQFPGPPMQSGPPPKRSSKGYWDPATMVPAHERRATSNGIDVDTYWIKDLDKGSYDTLKQARKCLLCKRENHMLDGCRDRPRQFANGAFFYYKKSLKTTR